MPRIPQALIDQILDRTDIVDLVSNYVNLKRRGQNFFGICPFHKEKTGSFSVHPERQMFKCFGCGKGGTAITFVQEIENLTFGEAVRFLAEKAGVRIEFEDDGRGEKRVQPELDRTKVMETAVRLFEKWLKGSSEAQEYLSSRGLDDTTIRRFRLGYAPDSWGALHEELTRKNIPAAVQQELGLVIPRKDGNGFYDRFRNRIMFPIATPLGKIVAFGGRILGEGEPKYLNSPETPLFNKSRTLYLIEKAREPIRREGRMLVVEGYTDAIALHRFGFEYSVASLGTALTESHARLLRRYGENIYLLYDGDEAGLLAARRGVEVFLNIGLPVRIALLPPGEDPDSLLGKEGRGTMEEVLEKARDGFEFCIDRAVQTHGVDHTAGKRAVSNELLPMVARIPEAVLRAECISILAGRVGVDETAVKEDLRRVRQRRPRTSVDESSQVEPTLQIQFEQLEPAERAKAHIIAVLLNTLGLVHPDESADAAENLGQRPLTAQERERINQVVDLIPDRDGYPFSIAIKRLLAIKPRTYKSLAGLMEGAFEEEPALRNIVSAAPDWVPASGDRGKMLRDATDSLESQRRKLDHWRLASPLRGSDDSTDWRAQLKQLDALHGLAKKNHSPENE